MSLGLLSMMFAIYCLGVIGASMIAHRMIAHRSLKLRRPLKEFFVCLSLPAGTPIQWAGNHRQHHRATDTETDPHSPYFGGFWHAHCGWYIHSKNPIVCFLYAIAGPFRTLFDAWHRPRSNQEYVALAADIAADPFMRFVSRPFNYAGLMLLQVSIVAGLFSWGWGGQGLMAYWASMVMVYNLGDSIDSVAHLVGRRNPNSKDQSRNNAFMALITGGEGWHANHHRHPGSAKIGNNFQIDPIWLFIRFLERLGLAYEVKRHHESIPVDRSFSA